MKRILASTIVTLLAVLLAAPLALAQSVRFEPRAIVVNPAPTFGVEVFLDKAGFLPSEPGVVLSTDADIHEIRVRVDIRPAG